MTDPLLDTLAFAEAVEAMEAAEWGLSVEQIRATPLLNETGSKRFRDLLTAALPAIRKGLAEEAKARSFTVESVEWGHPMTEVPEGSTRITVKGTVQPVAAGDTISYLAADHLEGQ